MLCEVINVQQESNSPAQAVGFRCSLEWRQICCGNPAEWRLFKIQSRLKCNSHGFSCCLNRDTNIIKVSVDKMGHAVCYEQETKIHFDEMCFYFYFFGAYNDHWQLLGLLCAGENKPLNQMLGFECFPHRCGYGRYRFNLPSQEKKNNNRICRIMFPYS